MYGVFSIAQIAAQFSTFTSQFWWFALMPTYAYQIVVSMLQVFTYCTASSQFMVVEPFDYQEIIEKPTFGAFVNLSLSQLTPSRFNIIPDVIGLALAAYVNNWTMALWFASATPINLGYQLYYLADPLADMPPFLLINDNQKYDDVIG